MDNTWTITFTFDIDMDISDIFQYFDSCLDFTILDGYRVEEQ